MKRRRKRTIFERLEYFGLTTEYADGLPANVCGCLDPHEDPRFIMINRNLPRSEQSFTIAHELAHYTLHHRRCRFPITTLCIMLLSRMSKFQWAKQLANRLRRFVRAFFEIEANLSAICILISCDAMDDLRDYLKHHPEKKLLFLFACFAFVVARIDDFINP